MELSNQEMIVQFLQTFFKIFDAEINSISIVAGKVNAIIYWPHDNEKQDICWQIPDKLQHLQTTIKLIEYLLSKNLIYSDMVRISEEDLTAKLLAIDWNEPDIFNAINFLFSIEVFMVDYGEQTDSFFLHY